MIYRILEELTILLHFAWILFLIFGLIIVWVKPKIAFVHLPGLLFSLVLNMAGWYCPLTYLEHFLHISYASEKTYQGSFVGHWLEPIIYPDLPEGLIRGGEIVFVLLYLLGYAYLAKKHRFLKRMSRVVHKT